MAVNATLTKRTVKVTSSVGVDINGNMTTESVNLPALSITNGVDADAENNISAEPGYTDKRVMSVVDALNNDILEHTVYKVQKTEVSTLENDD